MEEEALSSDINEELESEIQEKFYKPLVQDAKQTEDINLTVTGFEFGDKVKVLWVNDKTGEEGHTEISHELYNAKFRI